MLSISTIGRAGIRCSSYIQQTGAISVHKQQQPLQFSRGCALSLKLNPNKKISVHEISGQITIVRHSSDSATKSRGRVLKAEEIKPVHVGEIKTFLDENNISYNEGYTCLITSCPKHVKKKFNLNEVDKLYINMTTGNYVCHSCKRTGCWPSLKENMQTFFEQSSLKKK
jgi:hypothetical protein